MKKLYAYTDGDGFVRFNTVGGRNKALWNQRTREYIEPEAELNIDQRLIWLAIGVGYVLGVLGLIY